MHVTSEFLQLEPTMKTDTIVAVMKLGTNFVELQAHFMMSVSETQAHQWVVVHWSKQLLPDISYPFNNKHK